MKQYRRQILLLFILLFALAACAQVKPITPPATTPTETPTVKPTKTQTATYPPISMAGATATPDAREVLDQQVKEFGIDCSYYKALISPEGNWAAAACGYDSDQTLQIADQSGVVYTLKFSDYLSDYFADEFSGEGNPMGGLTPLHWTADEQYLFFSPYFAWDGDATCFYGIGDGGLFRISLKDGKVSTILPISQMMQGYFFAFSSNDRYLAYIYKDLHILDINSGENYSLKLKNSAIGDLTWSPDNTRLGFSTCEVDPDNETEIINSSIQYISVLTHERKIIKDIPEKVLRIEYSEDNSYLLISEYGGNWTEDLSLYYWDTGLIINATPESK